MSQSSPAGGLPVKPVFRESTADAARAMTVFVLIVVTLYFGREVLVPITLALMLCFLLAPLVTLLRRIHLGRVPSVLLAVVLALVVLVGIGGVIGSQIAELATGLPQYATQIRHKVRALETGSIGRVSHVLNRIGASGETGGATAAAPPGQQAAAPVLAAHQSAAPRPAAAPVQQVIPVAAPGPPATPRELIMQYLGPVLAPFATFGIVIVVTTFALLQREDLRDRMIRLIGSADIHRTTLAMDDAGRRLSRYFLTQLAVNTFFGAIIGAGLYFIGVPKPVLWGMLATVLRFVPYIGALISALLPIALAAAIQPGWSMALWTAAFFAAAEGVTGQAVEPLLYGHSTGLSPFSVVVAAIFWSWVWGPMGLILSTPLTLCLVVMGRHVQRLEFLDVLLGNRPALSPVESFYQRILAGDPDEALQQAEQYLKTEPLAQYYDNVVLKAMQMATFDAERGVLGDEQLSAAVETIKILVGSFDEHGSDGALTGEPDPGKPGGIAPSDIPVPDGLPEDFHAASAVLCVAGRGVLDAPAAIMLTQLLVHGKFGCRAVTHSEVARDAIRNLDISAVKIVCLAYLDLTGSHAQLRYLIRRLRQKLPAGTPIVVGLWPADDEAAQNEDTRMLIGADYFSSSFEEVVSLCRKLAQTAPEESVKSAA